jgi:lysophospholipase L1-like esterase
MLAAMKQVTLIGDSIRLGYEARVRQALAGIAAVWGPPENGAHTTNLLVHLHLWVLNRQPRPDVVHINAGLHDLKTIWYGGQESIVPVEHYRRNVEILLRAIRERTTAKVIWATTTPVIFERAHAAHAPSNDFDRFDEYVVSYNIAATQVCKRLGVPVNDLYSAVATAGKEQLLGEDGVHFTPAGQQLLGQAVAAKIREVLA